MLKEIKTKVVIKDIKALDKTSDISRRMKNAYIRTKDQAKRIDHNDDRNYVDDTGNSIVENTETVTQKTGHTAGHYSKKVIGKVKESIKQSVSQPGAITDAKHNLSIEPRWKAAVEPSGGFSKTGRTTKKTTETGRKAVKEATKGMIKTLKKSVKTAGYTTKATIKTSQAAAKTTAKTVVRSAQASKRAIQQARAAARAVAFTVKAAAKAIAITIKATIVAVKGLITLIAVGGWIAIAIILVICLAGFLLSSVFGIFLSNESYNHNTMTMTEVINELSEEFITEYEQIKEQYSYDTLVLSGNANVSVNNWHDILAVYAVRVTDSVENSMEVATIDNVKKNILRSVFWDMNSIDYWLESIEHEETIITIDEDDNEIEKTITTTETILYINVSSKSCWDMKAEYNLNEHQVKMLNELMQDEYKELFLQLIGG